MMPHCAAHRTLNSTHYHVDITWTQPGAMNVSLMSSHPHVTETQGDATQHTMQQWWATNDDAHITTTCTHDAHLMYIKMCTICYTSYGSKYATHIVTYKCSIQGTDKHIEWMTSPPWYSANLSSSLPCSSEKTGIGWQPKWSTSWRVPHGVIPH